MIKQRKNNGRKTEKAIYKAARNEPFAKNLGMTLVDLALGYSRVEMTYHADKMDNIYQRDPWRGIYSLIDEAFGNLLPDPWGYRRGLNVNVSYTASPEPGARLIAEARKSRSKKIAHYDISVTDDAGQLIATAKTIAFRTGKPIPFYDKS
ncbi:MAG: PaaI family thioesterase [Desulfobacterales bacterium]